MTRPTSTSTEQTADGAEDFTTSEGLRALLRRLAADGDAAWQEDPAVRALMEHAAQKYAALARKHDLDPWEAAAAAFDVMRTRAARDAADPWAVITHAVRITCIYEQRAQGLLCSVHQARRPHVSAFHDPERFSERDTPLADHHPAFHIADPHDADPAADADDGGDHGPGADGPGGAVKSASMAVEDAVRLVTELGWPADVADAAIDYVCTVLTRSGNRQSAFETLRRDKYALAFLDLPRSSWTALLRALLGTPDPAYAATSAGRGILLRLLIGETPATLLRDDDLVLTIALASPTTHRGERS